MLDKKIIQKHTFYRIEHLSFEHLLKNSDWLGGWDLEDKLWATSPEKSRYMLGKE